LSLAIVGTGPDVGKTVVSAVLLTRYGRELPLVYWKPVETGAVQGRDAEIVDRLAGHCCEIVPETYLFLEPVALHVAARMESRRIDPRRLRLDFETGSRDGRQWIVDTIGGLLVPLSDAGPLFGDLLVDLALPCLVVAPSALATLNHTLLTLEALRSRGLEPVGVVLNGPPDAESRRAVEGFGEVEVIAEVPPLEPLDREAVERAAGNFDEEGRLERYLSPDIRG
jgi:dethiobiotin synthetase